MSEQIRLDRQQGMTAIGWLVVLALIGFFVLLTLRIGPVYLNYYKVASSIESLGEGTSLSDKTRNDIRKSLLKRFQVNDVKEVSAGDIVIAKSGAAFDVDVAYEHRVKVIGNIDVVVSFHKSATVE